MIIVTWNAHWCRGIDGVVNPDRIVKTAQALADFDVLCLQEIAINFDGLPGSRGEDQMAALSAALPDYTALYGASVDLDAGEGRRRQFGNAIFSRFDVGQVFRHLLPWPADNTVPNMQRMALEAVVHVGTRPIRVISTHLEYFSLAQRMAQVDGLLRIQAEAQSHSGKLRPITQAGEAFDAVSRPVSAIVCGDFNFRADSPEHARLTASTSPAVTRFVDAWQAKYSRLPHPATVGVHEDLGGPFCCDFFFVTEEIAPHITRVWSDADTQASVHQPVAIELSL